MAEDKQNYSLINVEVAEEPEEVIRVDAAGIHTEATGVGAVESLGAKATTPITESFNSEAAATTEAIHTTTEPATEKPMSDSTTHSTKETNTDDVPMPGMQKAIVVILAVALVAFVVYFVMTYC